MITSSHLAPLPSENILSSGVVTVIDPGSSNIFITVPVIDDPMLQICLEARSKNANTKVRRNSILGSSASKPAPDIITFRD